MAEIKSIHGGRAPGEPSVQIVETLERLLADAKSGELIGLGYATVLRTKAIGTGWDGEAAEGLRYTLGSAIHLLDHRYVSACILGNSSVDK